MNDATWRFVHEHLSDDVRQLALQGSGHADVDMAGALQQIQGWQTARSKLPSWAATEGMLYPPRLSMEQCSGERAARHKTAVVSRLLAADGMPMGRPAPRTRLVDLTGGFGVDFAFMAPLFSEAVYVERQPALCSLATHNFSTLGLAHATVVCADGTDYLRQMPPATLVFIDPARRDDHGARTFGMADCTPNVLPLIDVLLQKARLVMLKLSPMLDWRKAMADVGPQHVAQVHIVAVGGECKELLLVLAGQTATGTTLVCTNDDSSEEFALLSADGLSVHGAACPAASSAVWGMPQEGGFLYEPNAALMKAGLFAQLAARYGVAPLARDSHLFVSASPVGGFPGRAFSIVAVSSLNKQDLRRHIAPLRQANISVRNFPLTAARLRQRLRLSDGGPHYIVGTTLADGRHVLLLCRRA